MPLSCIIDVTQNLTKYAIVFLHFMISTSTTWVYPRNGSLWMCMDWNRTF